jgi:hypothetical protein
MLVNKAKFSIVLLTLSMFCAPVWSQQVYPQPANPNDELRLRFNLNAQSCFNRIIDSQVDVTSRPIEVSYIVEPVANPVCVLPPLLTLNVLLGSFEQGIYQVIIEGSIDGEAQSAVTTSFEVRGLAAPRSVPLDSEPALYCLALCVFFLGILRARGQSFVP